MKKLMLCLVVLISISTNVVFAQNSAGVSYWANDLKVQSYFIKSDNSLIIKVNRNADDNSVNGCSSKNIFEVSPANSAMYLPVVIIAQKENLDIDFYYESGKCADNGYSILSFIRVGNW